MKKNCILNRTIIFLVLVLGVSILLFGCSSNEKVEKNDESQETQGETAEPEETVEQTVITFPEYTGIDYTFSRVLLNDVSPDNKRSFNFYHNNKKINEDVLPTYRFDSYSQWMEYKDAFGTDYSKVREMFEKYDEPFFESNSLFIFHAYLYKNKWYNVESVKNDNGVLTISLISQKMGFDVYFDNHQFYSIGVAKKDLENCEEVVVREVYPRSNSLELLHKLEKDDPRALVVRAFLNKDHAKLEKLSGLPAGTLKAYNTFDVENFTLYVFEDSYLGGDLRVELAAFVKLINEDEKDESLAILYGNVGFEVLEEDGYPHLVYRKDLYRKGGVSGMGSEISYLNSWLNDPWFEYELDDENAKNNHLGWTYSDTVYFFLYKFFKQDSANNDLQYTDDQIAKKCKETAEKVFALKDHSGFQTNFKKDSKGKYQFITNRKQVETVIDVLEQYDDGALVQFYADYGCTVKSHLVRYTYSHADTGVPTEFSWEIIEKSEFEPYKYFFGK